MLPIHLLILFSYSILKEIMTYEESFQYTVDGDALLILFLGEKKKEKGGVGVG